MFDIEYTTVRVSKGTSQWIERIRSYYEYHQGKKLNQNAVVRMAVMYLDYHLANKFDLTEENMVDYFEEVNRLMNLSPVEIVKVIKSGEDVHSWLFIEDEDDVEYQKKA